MGTDSSTDCHIPGGHSLQELGQSHSGICWLIKQPQENLTSWPSPLDSSSHPHNSYLSSRVAISTTISKLVPCVLLFSYFFIQFFSSVYFLILTYFFLDFHLYITFLHSFYSASVLSTLSIPNFLYRCTPFVPKLPFHALQIWTMQLHTNFMQFSL